MKRQGTVGRSERICHHSHDMPRAQHNQAGDDGRVATWKTSYMSESKSQIANLIESIFVNSMYGRVIGETIAASILLEQMLDDAITAAIIKDDNGSHELATTHLLPQIGIGRKIELLPKILLHLGVSEEESGRIYRDAKTVLDLRNRFAHSAMSIADSGEAIELKRYQKGKSIEDELPIETVMQKLETAENVLSDIQQILRRE